MEIGVARDTFVSATLFNVTKYDRLGKTKCCQKEIEEKMVVWVRDVRVG